MINKFGECSECEAYGLITKPSLMLCVKCNNKRLRKQKDTKTKATGELDVFREIWKERKHVSFISGKPLKEFNVWCFAHVLSKGSSPKFRLNKENIVLLTPKEHVLFDNGSHENREAYAKANSCSWDELYELKDKLKSEYYG
jgi:hypothetical protein